MKVALVVQVNNENRYLDEFINYYKKLGIDHIYMIDHNDFDDENLHDIIDKYGEYITYDDKRGVHVKDLLSFTYKHIYDLYNYLYDWMCFFDVDEFLTLKYDNTIQDYLSRNIFYGIDQIHINWLTYDDNDLIEYDDRPVQERFTRISNIYDKEINTYHQMMLKYGCKSIIRSGLNIWAHIHTFVSLTDKELITVDGNGESSYQMWGSCDAINRYNLAYLKHYTTKSLNEYIYKKYNKMDGLNKYKYLFDYYFIINNHTIEKDKYVNNYLNLMTLYK